MKSAVILKARYAKPITPANAARKALLRQVRRREMRRLQAIVPSVARLHHRNVDELTVLHEAVRYIDQLHSTLIARLQAGNLSEAAMDRINPAELQRIVAAHSQHLPLGRLLESPHVQLVAPAALPALGPSRMRYALAELNRYSAHTSTKPSRPL